MIKSAIILVLLVLLAGGAFLSRPSKASFETYLRDRIKAGERNVLINWGLDMQIRARLEAMEFKDRYLWVQVEEGGKITYIGAFSKFFSLADAKPDATPAENP